MTKIEQILTDREKTYGSFAAVAEVSQEIKRWFDTDIFTFKRQPVVVKESIEMIASKLARIACGDPLYRDSWVDIAGYSKLTENFLREEGYERPDWVLEMRRAGVKVPTESLLLARIPALTSINRSAAMLPYFKKVIQHLEFIQRAPPAGDVWARLRHISLEAVEKIDSLSQGGK